MKIEPEAMSIRNGGGTVAVQPGVLVVLLLPAPILKVTPERVDPAHRMLSQASRLYVGLHAEADPLTYQVDLLEGPTFDLLVTPQRHRHPLAYAVHLDARC